MFALACTTLRAVTAESAPPSTQPASKMLRVYHIGNSVTDQIRYQRFATLVAARGNRYVFGRHMIPGTPLEGLWAAQDKGFREEPFGASQKALADFTWDVVTIQPFDRQIDPTDGMPGDFETAAKFIDLIVARSPSTRILLYQRWAVRELVDPKNAKWDGKDAVKPIDYAAAWKRPYTGRWDGSYATADFFDRLAKRLNDKYDHQLEHPIELLRVGDVMAELDRRIRAGTVPGLTTIDQIYADHIHLTEVGSYLVGVTLYATLFGDSPIGLPFDGYAGVTAEIAQQIRQAVETVLARPGEKK